MKKLISSEHLTPRQRQVILTAIASFGYFVCGTYIAWSSPFTKLIENQKIQFGRTISDRELKWIISWIDFGAIISPIVCAFMMDRYGRKAVIVASAPFCPLSWLMIYSGETFWVLNVARIIQGLHCGFSYLVLPIYVSEIASPKIRGAAGIGLSAMLAGGILFVNIVGSFASYETLNLCCLVISLVYLCLVFNLLETSYFYLLLRNDHSARKIDLLLNDDFSENQFQHMRNCVNIESETSVIQNIFVNKTNLRPLVVVFFLSSSLCLTFFWNTPSYATFIFNKSGATYSSDFYPIVLGILLLVAVFPSAYFIDRVGRRKLIFVSASLTALSAFLISSFFYFDRTKDGSHSWIILILICCFLFFANIGIAQVPVVLLGEYFPSNTRASLSSIVTAVSSIFAFCADILFESIANSVGMHVNYILSGTVALSMALFTWLFMLETKGKTLHDIHLSFKSRSVN